MKITGSIVTFHNNLEDIKKVIDSFLSTGLDVKLFVSDNSSDKKIEVLCKDYRIEYIYNDLNLGFGAAHNVAMKKAIEKGSTYHVVLNPDIYFNTGVIEALYDYMEKNTDTGLIMPKILYPDGEIQYLAKFLPTPFNLIFRRFIPIKWILDKMNYKYEMRFTGYDKIMEVPFLSGCFMFLRVEALKKVGLFDEKIFMYLEDVDLSRRIHKEYRTVFYPHVAIYHKYDKSSFKNRKTLMYHTLAAIYYFNKWGWFFDRGRTSINRKVSELQNSD